MKYGSACDFCHISTLTDQYSIGNVAGVSSEQLGTSEGSPTVSGLELVDDEVDLPSHNTL